MYNNYVYNNLTSYTDSKFILKLMEDDINNLYKINGQLYDPNISNMIFPNENNNQIYIIGNSLLVDNINFALFLRYSDIQVSNIGRLRILL